MKAYNMKLQHTLTVATAASLAIANAANAQTITDTKFNPALSVVLDGGFASTSHDPEEYGIAGFDVGAPEGRVEGDGFYAGHNEITASSNVDDLFYGQATVVVAEHDGEAEMELEEAFIQTLGLGHGATIKAGRMLPVFGYLNEKHLHQDFFVERPLAYQAFLGGHLVDDGVEVSVILPTDLYAEVGAGVFRGNGYPATSDDGISLYKAHARVGGDISDETSWRLGAHYMHTDPEGREAGAGHDHGGGGHADELEFTGDSDLYALEAKLEWAPKGNSTQQKLELRGEYFIRQEDGNYDDGVDTPAFDGTAHGFYTQAAYKFHPNWWVGARYDHLFPEDDIDEDLHETAVDAEGHEPKASTVSLQYAPSEFSRVRASYSNADLSAEEDTDHRFFLNFQVSLGAHGAHKY